MSIPFLLFLFILLLLFLLLYPISIDLIDSPTRAHAFPAHANCACSPTTQF